jgi:hypothetical protein
MVIYGGNGNTGPLSSIHILNLDTYVWEVPPIIGKHPGTRESMGFCSNKGKMYISCGNVGVDCENEIYANDFYELSLDTNNSIHCQELEINGERPCARIEPSI